MKKIYIEFDMRRKIGVLLEVFVPTIHKMKKNYSAISPKQVQVLTFGVEWSGFFFYKSTTTTFITTSFTMCTSSKCETNKLQANQEI